MTEPEHLLRRLNMRDVEESAERMVIEMDNRPDLVNIRGAIQGGLVPIIDGPARAVATVIRKGKRSIVTRVEVTDVGRDRLAAIATLSFAVLDPR